MCMYVCVYVCVYVPCLGREGGGGGGGGSCFVLFLFVCFFNQELGIQIIIMSIIIIPMILFCYKDSKFIKLE